jgi:hypothetical protein
MSVADAVAKANTAAQDATAILLKDCRFTLMIVKRFF